MFKMNTSNHPNYKSINNVTIDLDKNKSSSQTWPCIGSRLFAVITVMAIIGICLLIYGFNGEKSFGFSALIRKNLNANDNGNENVNENVNDGMNFNALSSNCDIYAALANTDIEIYSIGDSGYATASHQYASENVFHSDIKPNYITYAYSADDVQTIVSFVNDCDEIDHIAIRSGGHQYSGLSSCKHRCLQIDLSNMNDFEVIDDNYIDPTDTTGFRAALVRVAPGLNYFELYPITRSHGLVFQGGLCGTVHVGGNYQSSADNIFAHSLGSGMDYIQSFDIILANGELITVDGNNDDADLFWSVRGGSPGAFGIIVSYDVKVYYATNFPHAAVEVLYYRLDNNNNNNGDTLDTLDSLEHQTDVLSHFFEAYSEATQHNSFVNGLDYSIYAQVMSLEDVPLYKPVPGLKLALEKSGGLPEYVMFATIIYLGFEENVPWPQSNSYSAIVDGLFKNESVVIEAPVYQMRLLNEFLTNPEQLPGLVAGHWIEEKPFGYVTAMGNEPFSFDFYHEYARRIVNLINKNDNNNDNGNNNNDLLGDDLVVSIAIQGAVYGGRFHDNDANNKHTARVYRDTRAWIDLQVFLEGDGSVSDSMESVYDYDGTFVRLQGICDDTMDSSLRNLIDNEEDRYKKMVAYTHGDRNIENVWRDYYNNDVSIYNRLRCSKYLVDPNELFSNDFTIKPMQCDRK